MEVLMSDQLPENAEDPERELSLFGKPKARSLFLKLTNASSAPSYLEVSKQGPLEDNGSRTSLGVVPCNNGEPVEKGKPASCTVEGLLPGYRVEVSRISEGKTAVVRGFDIPKDKDYFNNYSYGSKEAPVTIAVDAPTVPAFSEENMTNALNNLARAVSLQEGFRPMPRVSAQSTFLGGFFVADTDDNGPAKNPNFDDAKYSVSIPLDSHKDLPQLESIFPIQVNSEVLTSYAAKASLETKIPTIALVSLAASGSLFVQISASVVWYNFRISKSISEAIALLNAQQRAGILSALKNNSATKLLFVNGMTVVQSFNYKYKNAKKADSSNAISFTVGSTAFTFDHVAESSGGVTLPDHIVRTSTHNLGGHAQVAALLGNP
jgi:hypothetical protein